MQTINLQTLQIHQFVNDEQYRRALESGQIPSYSLALTPADSDDTVSIDDFSALQQEVSELKSTLNQALDVIIALQNFYINGETPSFYIYDTLCSYRPGMAWSEWIGSEYHIEAQSGVEEVNRWSIFNNEIRNPANESLYATDGAGNIVWIKTIDIVGEYNNYSFQHHDFTEEGES